MKPPRETTYEHPDDSVRIRDAKSVAGGADAIVSTLKHAAHEMGVVRGAGALLKVNQTGGFDCPGCAWPDPDEHRAATEFCENGAKAVAAEATTKLVGPEFFATWSVDELAAKPDVWLNAQGRITHPMVLRPGATHYARVTWDEAFELIARELRALASPDEAVFYTSGRTSNEAAFLYQLFVRQFGTNNLPDCSNMCHESSGCALKETIGVGKGTVTLHDFDHADTIFIIGQNPGTNHPRMLSTLQRAAKRGCNIVSINPLFEAGTTSFIHPQDALGMLLDRATPLATLELQVRINGDVALLKGIMKAMLAREERAPGEVLDREFIEKYTVGFDDFALALRDVSWTDIVDASGIARERIEEAARIAASSRATIACWAMGLTQHKNAVANIQEVVNLLLLRGNIGKPGAGVCPVRGHSNVQGDRTMGIWEKMPESFLSALGAEFDFEPPRRHGMDTVQSIGAMLEGRAHVFFALGGNFLSAAPDTLATARALRNCRLTAQVSTKLNRSHLVTGKTALILPCFGRTEIDHGARGAQFVSVENSMGIVHASRGHLTPASPELRSEAAILCGLARATLGGESSVDWESLAADYDRVREHIARVVPGFDDFNERVRKKGGFYLPNAAKDRVFQTESGKAYFTVHPLAAHRLAPGRWFMMTIRSHDQFNTTIYGLDDRYRGIAGARRVLLLHADDITDAGFSPGDIVDVTSEFDDGDRTARAFRLVPYRIPRGCAAAYFPEANELVPLGSVADKSGTPASKSVVIRIARAASDRT